MRGRNKRKRNRKKKTREKKEGKQRTNISVGKLHMPYKWHTWKTVLLAWCFVCLFVFI